MSTFVLSPEPQPAWSRPIRAHEGFGPAILVANAKWFTRIRWIAVGVFLLIAIGSEFAPGVIGSLGLVPPAVWPWWMAGILAAANVALSVLAHQLTVTSPAGIARTNIWLQIIVDLGFVTVLVHLVGSTTTFIAFIYVLHIVLACVFFPRRSSLLVTLLASNAYLLCVLLEETGVWPATSILPVHSQAGRLATPNSLLAGSAIFIWFIVWYLVSHLATALSVHDQQIQTANEELRRADQEKNQRVLRTTHDLKAPFSGIESSIQALRILHWQELPPAVQEILQNIEMRARVLRARIRDILLLGEIRSQADTGKTPAFADLQAIVRGVVDDLEETIRGRRLTVNVEVPSAEIAGEPGHLTILFSNIIANAVSYSHEDGTVGIRAREEAGRVCLVVEDHGIGIREDALPHIFDEYYRTNEAAQFNRLSTGLGLAIVREIAGRMGLTLKVSSVVGSGTTFEVCLPRRKPV